MEKTQKTAHLQYSRGQITITSPYDADFVSELKAGLKSRRWNPKKKAWTADIKERQKLLEIAGKYYQVIEDKQTDESSPASLLNQAPVQALSSADINSILKPGMELEIWTDGACIANPGPGGYGIVFKYREHMWEKAGGFHLTTNNRMEITAALVALETLPEKCKVVIRTDSQYLVNSMTKGWAKNWQSKGWKKGNKHVPNADLWEKMLKVCSRTKVEFSWVRGHDANPDNERCDRLAVLAARKRDLPVDEGYSGSVDD